MDITINSPILSIVICTFNRANLVGMAIESVLQQKASVDSYELIVVDNASTDDTREVVEQLSSGRKNVRYVFEEKQGLSHARNRGWKEALGEYIIYIDDECLLPNGYLGTALKIIAQQNPNIFGGLIKAYFDYKKPDWVKEEYFSFFLDRKTGILSKSEYVFGGNMGIRRDGFAELGGFNTNLGMKGVQLAFYEEIEFQQRAIDRLPGIKVYYDSNLYLYHQVRQEKLNLGWLLKYHFYLGFNSLEGLNAFQVYQQPTVQHKWGEILQKLAALLYRVIRICARVPVLVFWRSEKYPYWQQYLVERIYGVEVNIIGRHCAEIEYILRSLWRKKTNDRT